jgi:hypothetical protein
LVIEDDSATAQSIELMLKSESFIVYTTDLGEEGIDLGKRRESPGGQSEKVMSTASAEARARCATRHSAEIARVIGWFDAVPMSQFECPRSSGPRIITLRRSLHFPLALASGSPVLFRWWGGREAGLRHGAR